MEHNHSQNHIVSIESTPNSEDHSSEDIEIIDAEHLAHTKNDHSIMAKPEKINLSGKNVQDINFKSDSLNANQKHMGLSEITSEMGSKNKNLRWVKAINQLKWIFIIVMTVLTIWLLCRSPWGKQALDTMYQKIVDLLHYDRKEFIAVFFVGHFVYNLTFLPGHTYFFLLMPYLLKDLWLSFFIIWISYECSVIAGYFGIKVWFYKRFQKKFKNDYKFKMIKDSVKDRPIAYSSLVWMIVIPDIMKMIMLTLADVGFWTYFLTSIPQYGFQSFLYSYTGTSLKDFSDAASENGGWSGMDFSQKMNFIVTIVFITISFIVIAIWGCYISKKLKEYKLLEESKQQEEELLKGENVENFANQDDFYDESDINGITQKLNVHDEEIGVLGSA